MALYPPYSTRFLVVVTTTGTAFEYTVPAGRVAIVDSLTVVKTTASTPVDVYFYLIVTGPGTTAAFHFQSFIGTTKIESSVWNGRVVLNPGDKLGVQRSTVAGNYSATASGFLLTIPP